MESLARVKDFGEAAEKILGRNAHEYFNSGTEDEITLRENRDAYQRWFIRPRVLKNAENPTLSTTVLGNPIAFPLGICPMAMQKIAHLDGEIATAKAAASMGVVFILSTFSTTSIEDIARASPTGRKWFQLFPQRNSEDSLKLIRRAEAAGFEAIVTTTDAQNIGKRRVNARNPLKFPSHLKLANFEDESGNGNARFKSIKDHVHGSLLQNFTWDFVTFLKRSTHLPIVLKGILTREDARIAVQYGVDAIYVSNHGGRQVESISATIDLLPGIVKEVNNRCEVYIDGGVLRGSDIFKALAIGAKMVVVGRPIIWGLAVEGEKGAREILEILRNELDITMQFAGAANIQEIISNFVVKHQKSQL